MVRGISITLGAPLAPSLKWPWVNYRHPHDDFRGGEERTSLLLSRAPKTLVTPLLVQIALPQKKPLQCVAVCQICHVIAVY